MTVLPIERRPTEHPLSTSERERLLQDPGFGRVFSDHMVSVRYERGEWREATVRAYAPITLDPAAAVLHYGQAIFEGFKAYRQPDGGIAAFRPDANAERFAASARRLAMPALPTELFVAAGDALISEDRLWVPPPGEQSYYLRPLMIATEAFLGVRPADEYLFLLFGSPSGPYFKQGVKPVTVWISEDYVRAAPGGTGAAKCAGNYAASLLAQKEAAGRQCDQVVWLDAVERRWVEEMGGMNLCFVYQKGSTTTLVTPALTGTLLPGITRDSLLQLAKDFGFQTEERPISVQEWEKDLKSGVMTEVFACGTAAIITPVGTVRSKSGEWSVGDGQSGPVATRLRKALLDIQLGHAEDRHGWMHRVC